jgi:zinc finger SWIM domain-containing protein 3
MLVSSASVIVNDVAGRFTQSVFHIDVHYYLKPAEKCYLIEEMDGYNIIEYKVGRVDKGDKQYFCEM